MNLKLSQHFSVKEFFTSPYPEKKKIYREFLEKTGEKKCKQNIDNRHTIYLEHIRTYFNEGKYKIEGKERSIILTSGWRFIDAKNPFKSQHPLGRGVDWVVSGIEPLEVKLYILENWRQDKILQLIRGIEDFDGMTWIHTDVRNSNRLYWFSKHGGTVSNEFYKTLIKNELTTLRH